MVYISESLTKIVFERSGKKCDGCGHTIALGSRQKGDWGAWNVDHIRPLSIGCSQT